MPPNQIKSNQIDSDGDIFLLFSDNQDASKDPGWGAIPNMERQVMLTQDLIHISWATYLDASSCMRQSYLKRTVIRSEGVLISMGSDNKEMRN